MSEERRLKIRQFVARDLLGEPDLDLGDDEAIFSSGLVDSFSAVRLLAFLHQEFQLPTDGVGLEDLDTLNKCVALCDVPVR
jgi:acyl carrier protein